MDQVGYQGVDENTFRLAAEGKTPPPEEGEERPGLTSDSLAPVETRGFGRVEREGLVERRRR